jgi:hypothetical protein
MEKRFGSLRTVSHIYKVIGALIILGGAIAAFSAFTAPYGFGFVTGIITVIVTLLLAVSCSAFGDLIMLLVALEENTRATAEALSRMRKSAAPQPPQLRKSKAALDDFPDPEM